MQRRLPITPQGSATDLSPRAHHPSGAPKDYDCLLKVVVIGDSGVGKSCLILRLADNAYTDSFISTIGVDFRFLNVTVPIPTDAAFAARDAAVAKAGTAWVAKDAAIATATAAPLAPTAHRVVRAQLWDTAGQERFATIASAFYRGAHCLVLVFDVSNAATLDALDSKDGWLARASQFVGVDTEFIVIGAKEDRSDAVLFDGDDALAARVAAMRLGARGPLLPLMFVSAKTSTRVTASFEALAAACATRMAREAYDERARHAPRAAAVPSGETVTLRPEGSRRVLSGQCCGR